MVLALRGGVARYDHDVHGSDADASDMAYVGDADGRAHRAVSLAACWQRCGEPAKWN